MKKKEVRFSDPELERSYKKAAKRVKFKKSDLGIKNL